jgi:hypothetical protein
VAPTARNLSRARRDATLAQITRGELSVMHGAVVLCEPLDAQQLVRVLTRQFLGHDNDQRVVHQRPQLAGLLDGKLRLDYGRRVQSTRGDQPVGDYCS